MSRRTKLSITALFLVLVAIPAIYMALTWSPQMPLRFRVIEARWKPEDRADTMVPVCFAVQNTSSHSVHLITAQLITSDLVPANGDSPGGITAMDPSFAGLPGSPVLLIPSHSTVSVWGEIRSDALRHARKGRLHLGCLWMSGAQRQAHSISVWLRFHSPSWLSSHIPWIHHEGDAVPLDGTVEP